MPNAQVQARAERDGEGVSYECDAGLQLVGPKTVSCLANGSWSLPTPACEGMTGFCSSSLSALHVPGW